jgi:hypothetical protein
MYKTNAAFNTNSLRLPLSVMVGIDNYRKTIPMAYYYITSKLATSFKFIADQLTDLAFHDCLEVAVIVGDFSKGLGATYATKATIDLGLTKILDEALVCPNERDKELLEAAKVIVGEAQGALQQILLWLCEWYTIKAIKRQLVTTR